MSSLSNYSNYFIIIFTACLILSLGALLIYLKRSLYKAKYQRPKLSWVIALFVLSLVGSYGIGSLGESLFSFDQRQLKQIQSSTAWHSKAVNTPSSKQTRSSKNSSQQSNKQPKLPPHHPLNHP